MMHTSSMIPAATLAVLLSAIMEGEARSVIADNGVFPTFTSHITKQVGIDKEAFAEASACLTWFYKGAKKAPPAAIQGIAWRRPVLLEPDRDCPRQYPGGMDTARDDFARKQAMLSVSLTVYEFALVADHNDDQQYNAVELRDLFHSLSLTYDTSTPPRAASATLTARFDQWYRSRSLEEVMSGMSKLYEQGYRMTAHDRAELDRVMK
ncbi:MAG TPA: hypothetical protein VL261_14795 [Nitrospira sp.]|jgi:hypothetical protein|nr:hypothetical protein [Nitrospira sp.]